MATAVQLQITLDSSGAVTGIKQLGGSLDDLGKKVVPINKDTAAGFELTAKQVERAHGAAQLFASITGVQMPRAMEGVIAKSTLLGPLMSKAFNAAIILSAANAAVDFASGIAQGARAVGGLTEDVLKMKAAVVAANTEAFANPQNMQFAQQNVIALSSANIQAEKLHGKFEDMGLLQRAWLSWGSKVSVDMEEQLKSMDRQSEAQDQNVAALKAETALRTQINSLLDAANAKVHETGKQGFALINQQLRDFEGSNQMTVMKLRDPITAQALIQAKTRETAALTMQLNRSIEENTQKTIASNVESTFQGEDKIRQAKFDSLQALITDMEHETGFTIQQIQKNTKLNAEYELRRQVITAASEHAIEELHRQGAERIAQLDSDAAVASLPEWQRAQAQIRAEHDKTVRQLQLDAKETVITQAQAAAGILAADQIMNARLRDESRQTAISIGSDLESAFDDMTSGNIGRRILNNMKKLFFQIVAEWLLATKAMGGIFGRIFGTLIGGPQSSLENASGGGIGSLLGLFGLGGGASALIPGTAAASTVAGGAAAAGGGLGAGLGTIGSASASGALTTAAGGTAAAGAALGGGLAIGPLSATSGLKGLFSAGGLAGLGGLALALGGGKLGGGFGQVGGILSSLVIMASLAPHGVAAGLLGHLGLAGGLGGALLAALGPALLGFGVGTKFGPLGGALAGGGIGIGAGALIGLAGGPIGALIGGLVGLVAGLFGGIFGSGKRKRQANNFFDSTVAPDIAKIEAEYKGFQLDYASAIGQLEDLRQQSREQLHKLKGQGDSVFKHRVGPAIDAAEKDINSLESERQRRAGLAFGPPEFHDGGFIDVAMAGVRRRPNEMLAVLKHGEFVVNPAATSRNRDTLERINNGGPSTPFRDLHIHPARLDRAYITDPAGFKRDLLRVINELQLEGRL